MSDDTNTRPVCECHGEPMIWQKYPAKRKQKGVWICRVKASESKRRWLEIPGNRERAKASQRKSYAKHREKRRKEAREYHMANRERARERNLVKKYGITNADYDRLLSEQGGVCAITGMKPPSGKTLVVDHCHKTGKVRGLLLDQYNFGLGVFDDDPKLLRKAADYLEKHQR